MRPLGRVENFKTFSLDTLFYFWSLHAPSKRLPWTMGKHFEHEYHPPLQAFSSTGQSVPGSTPEAWLHLYSIIHIINKTILLPQFCNTRECFRHVQRNLTLLNETPPIRRLSLNVWLMPQNSPESFSKTKLKAPVYKDLLLWVCLFNFTVNGIK